MRSDGGFEDFVEFGCFEFGVAIGGDFGDELEDFGDVFALEATGDDDGGIWYEVEVALKIV